MDLWCDDPESFSSDEGGESWKYALRPCTETFYTTLVNQFKTEMSVEIMKYINRAQQNNLKSESDLKEILLKDAIYNAAGLAAFHLFDVIDFDAWFTNQLIPEMDVHSDNIRIIRKRAIWLIGK